MSTNTQHVVTDDNSAKNHAMIAYILLAIGMFTAIPMIIGAIWAMFKRSDALGTVYHSHYTNAIRLFWWGVLWTVIGVILIFVLIGYAVLGALWLWMLYRLINGFIKIMADQPYPV